MSDEKKIIIDEDWKSQVEKEKETATAEGGQTGEEAMQMPPATFEFLVTSIITQAFAALGQIPDPQTNQAMIHFPLAKHHIDTLEMLQAKTKGNLDDKEEPLIDQALHELRMLYVSIEEAVATGQIKAVPGAAGADEGGIELP